MRAISGARVLILVLSQHSVSSAHVGKEIERASSKTFEWLNRAYIQRDAGMLWIKGEPFLRPFHSDPRFKVLLGKMHLS